MNSSKPENSTSKIGGMVFGKEEFRKKKKMPPKMRILNLNWRIHLIDNQKIGEMVFRGREEFGNQGGNFE